MRFCRQQQQRQQQAQARHRPQSEPSPNSCSLCLRLRLCPGPVRLIFKLPRLISRVNLCALYCIFASTFTRPGQRRSRRLSLGLSLCLSPGLAAVPDSFSQRIFRHVADKRSKAASTSALRCLRLGPLYLPPPSPRLSPLAHAPCYVFYLEQLPDEMPGLLLSRSRPGCPATNTTRCERSIDGAVR